MSSLPLLIEWGGVVAKVLVGGFAVLGVVGYRRQRNRADLRGARDDVAHMSMSPSELREGPLAFRGTYRVTEGTPWIESGGAHVALDAPLTVVRGSYATWSRGTRTYGLRDGDRIVVIGVVSRRASTATADYRESAGGWHLSPSNDEAAIQACIAVAVPCPSPLWPLRGVIAAVVAGAIAYVALGAIGEQLVDSLEFPSDTAIVDVEPSLSSQIAAALPRSRERALIAFSTELRHMPRTPLNLQRAVDFARLRGCAAFELTSIGRFEEAVTEARACGKPELARTALVALGRFDEAAQLAGAGIETLIAAGRWRDAATHAERRATDDGRCLAAHLRSLAGDPEPEGPGRVCRILAGTVTDEDRNSSAVIARWLATGEPPRQTYSLERYTVWLSPQFQGESSTLHRLRADRAMVLGDFSEASRELAAMEAFSVTDIDDAADRERYVRMLRNEIALRTGAEIEPFTAPDNSPRAEAAALLRAGAGETRDLSPSRRDDVASALDAARAGDGSALVRIHENDWDRFSETVYVEYLLAVAPMVKHPRAALARATQRGAFSDDDFPREVHRYALRRDLLRLLGDEPGAVRMQAIIDRYVTVLSDPQKLRALFLAHVH